MTPQTTFSIGDVVRLKAGGPDMVVQPVTPPYQIKMAAAGTTGYLQCQLWDNTKFVTQLFDPALLSLVTAYVAPATPVVFAPGTKVRNTAGGPGLTVETITFAHNMARNMVGANNFLPCQWQDSKGFHSEYFHPSALI